MNTVVDYVESLKMAVEKRDYYGTTTYVEKVCEEVLRYEKIAECSPENLTQEEREESGVLKMSIVILPPIVLRIPQIQTDLTEMPLKEIEPLEKIPMKSMGKVLQTIISDRCWHYGNASTENPEGVITQIFYEGTPGNYRLLSKYGEPLFKVGVYGKRWQNVGESIPIAPCFRTNLKLSENVSELSGIDFEKFIEELKK